MVGKFTYEECLLAVAKYVFDREDFRIAAKSDIKIKSVHGMFRARCLGRNELMIWDLARFLVILEKEKI